MNLFELIFCKHDYDFSEIRTIFSNAGCMVDADRYEILKCKKCGKEEIGSVVFR